MTRMRTWIGIGLLVVAVAGLAACGAGTSDTIVMPAVETGPNPHPAGSKFQIPSGQDGVPAIQIESLTAGSGAPVTQGKTVSIHYSGTAVGKTKPYNDTRKKGEPQDVIAGFDNLQPGFDDVVMQMRVGDRWKATIPPQVMFGANAGPNLPANSTIVVDVEVLAILD